MSSYLEKNLSYLDLIKCITSTMNPQRIVEFGILNGHSLQKFIETNATIEAYDIFDEFNGNHSNENVIKGKFSPYPNVKISYGDFYKKYEDLQDDNYDIIHVDIANNGDVYEFAINNYLDKIKDDGILLLEGGSIQRDEVQWMDKYKKRKINPYIQELVEKRLDLYVNVIGDFPSITIVKKKNLKISKLTESDVLNSSYFDLINYFTREISITKDYVVKNFDKLQTVNFRTYVVKYNGHVIGTGKIILEYKCHNNFKKMGHLEDIVISEKYKNKGVGKYLVLFLMKVAKNEGCYKVILNCNEVLIPFYLKCGLTKKGDELCKYF
jgi:glucosamine-phosphate N-acetyltransferase